MLDSIKKLVEGVDGKVGFYFKDIETGKTIEHNGELPLMAASVIKLPTMIETFRQVNEGLVSLEERFVTKKEDILPGCGALNVLHVGTEVTMLDLIKLMIVFSDNTATNMIIKHIGADNINAFMENEGLAGCRLNRLLFDAEASSRGIENYITAKGMGKLLEKLYNGQLVSKEYSEQMMDILFNQRLNGKIPLSLPRGTDVAHKTGEDDGITHDVGLVMGKHPFILCLCSNEVYAPDFDMTIHKVARMVWEFVEKE